MLICLHPSDKLNQKIAPASSVPMVKLIIADYSMVELDQEGHLLFYRKISSDPSQAQVDQKDHLFI